MLRRGCSARKAIALAGSSGWKIGGTGIGCLLILLRFQSNWGVFRPGSCTMQSLTLLFSCASSVITDSVNPFTACLDPQYGACNGIERKAIAEPTLTMTPRSRDRIRRSAASVPHTCPKYVTSVIRLHSSGEVSQEKASDPTNATFTHRSISPSSAST